MHRSRTVHQLILCAGLLAPASRADVLKVPSAAFPTIQSAVDAAVPFDKIKIAAGQYSEAVLVEMKTDLKIVGRGVVVIVDPGTLSPLRINTCQRVSVSRVRCSTAAGLAAILCEGCADVSIRNCRVLSSSDAGIWVSLSSNVRVEKNRIQNTTGNGIDGRFMPFGPGTGAVNGFVVGNVIRDCGENGIILTGAGNTLSKNRILRAANQGVFVLSGAVNTTIEKNFVARADVGIAIEAANCTLRKNVVSRSTRDGVQITGDDGIYEKCRVVKAGEDAWEFGVESNANSVTKCASKRAGASGFVAACTNSTFTSCKAKESFDLDLNDPAAGASTNSYVDCDFGTTNLP